MLLTRITKLALLTCTPLLLWAHPMGNFSVNHYSRIQMENRGLRLTYILDLAEVPTFELLGQWKVEARDTNRLEQKARQQAYEWTRNLTLTSAGRQVPLEVESVTPQVSDGAGGLPVLRLEVKARARISQSGAIYYEDRNYPGRAGWKEIVTGDQPDQSHGLTVYPTGASTIPPQRLTAELRWQVPSPSVTRRAPDVVLAASPVPQDTKTRQNFTQQQSAGAGSVVQGDFLSRLLQHGELTWTLILTGLVAAFGLGSMHALSPGHGKTLVAAYLVGTRGTWKHAGFLGLLVTFTHTASVFLLGLGVLFFQQYVVPEKVVPFLGVVSGLSIVGVGAFLLYQRSKALLHHGHHHHHHHHDHHDHEHAHHHHHHHDHNHAHTHTHDGHTHSHVPEGKLTFAGLVALGVSGGLVPCPSALILMLSAIALGRPALGLALLTSFSAGLALVLMGIGLVVVYARNLLPTAQKHTHQPWFRLLPVFSAVVVICLGLAMTAASAGWVQPLKF